MKKTVLIFFSAIIVLRGFGQPNENSKLIDLAKAYKNFMFRNEPTPAILTQLENNIPKNLNSVTKFIIQTITTNNNLLTQEFLTLPDNQVLLTIYIVESVNYNIRKDNPLDNDKLIDSLKLLIIPKNELIDSYYSMLFTAVGNKNKPFNYSKIDFDLNNYNLISDTEKGIFFLQCMANCGSEIWGYMNIVNPPNTKKAFDYIRKFPKFSGLKYFQFTDLNFPDFEKVISENEGKESYKSYYINKYYELLLSHLICLNKEGAKDKEIKDLLLGSILKDRIFYKYSKNRETLEGLFKEHKQ